MTLTSLTSWIKCIGNLSIRATFNKMSSDGENWMNTLCTLMQGSLLMWLSMLWGSHLGSSLLKIGSWPSFWSENWVTLSTQQSQWIALYNTRWLPSSCLSAGTFSTSTWYQWRQAQHLGRGSHGSCSQTASFWWLSQRLRTGSTMT